MSRKGRMLILSDVGVFSLCCCGIQIIASTTSSRDNPAEVLAKEPELSVAEADLAPLQPQIDTSLTEVAAIIETPSEINTEITPSRTTKSTQIITVSKTLTPTIEPASTSLPTESPTST
jgi:hypothetical protein